MRRKLPLWILLLPWMIYPAVAQKVTVTASQIGSGMSTGGTNVLSYGKFCVQPVDANDRPLIAAEYGGGGAMTTQQACVPVLSGALPSGYQLADTSLSTPKNLCYDVQIFDGQGHRIYHQTCVQPAASNSWCANGACDFDAYAPDIAELPLGPTYVQSIDGLSGPFVFSGANCTSAAGVTTCTFSGDGGSWPGYPPSGFAHSNGSAWDTPTSAELIALLGYTPYNSTNPNGYLSSITSQEILDALGYTPYNGLTNPNGYATEADLPTAADWPNAGSCPAGEYVDSVANGSAPTCAVVNWSQIASQPTIPNSSNWPNPGTCPNGEFVSGLANGASPACSTPSGSGNVTGPSSATQNNFASYGDTTGTLLKDSGYSPASFDTSGAAAAAQSAAILTAESASLQRSSNLSDLASASTARSNLGLGTAALHASTDFDASGAAASAQSAAEAASDPAGSAAAAQSAAISTAESASLQRSSNLSDLASASTARSNLGLGTAAIHASTDFDASGAAATAQSNAESYASNASNLSSGSVPAARISAATLATVLTALTGCGTANYVWSPASGDCVALSGFTAAGDLSGSNSSQEVQGLHNVPFCTGFTPANGQAIEYTTASSPNPCYTAATPSGGGSGIGTIFVLDLSGGLPAGGTRYYGLDGSTCGGGCSAASDSAVIPAACTAQNFYLNQQGTQGSTGSAVFTLYHNGSSTSITLTAAASSTTQVYSNTTASVTVAAGDTLVWNVVNNASTTAAGFVLSLQCK